MGVKLKGGGFWLTFSILFAFWLILSTFFDPVHISLGIVSSLIVAYCSHDLLIRSKDSGDTLKALRNSVKFFFYGPWLIIQILKANVDVVRIVLDPKLPISPRIIKFESSLPNEVALALFANSITLTPGTLTIDIDGKKNYYVHCLAKRHGDSLVEGKMQERVRSIFK